MWGREKEGSGRKRWMKEERAWRVMGVIRVFWGVLWKPSAFDTSWSI